MKEGVSLSQRILAAFCVLSALFLGYWAFAMTQSEGIFETGSFINVGSNDGQGSEILGPDPRKVDTSGVSYAALVSVAEFSASKTSGAERLHQECRRRVL